MSNMNLNVSFDLVCQFWHWMSISTLKVKIMTLYIIELCLNFSLPKFLTYVIILTFCHNYDFLCHNFNFLYHNYDFVCQFRFIHILWLKVAAQTQNNLKKLCILLYKFLNYSEGIYFYAFDRLFFFWRNIRCTEDKLFIGLCMNFADNQIHDFVLTRNIYGFNLRHKKTL